MKKKQIIGTFSEALIKRYLDSKAYEKRGWTKDKYIKKCKDAWNKTKYDPEYEKKILMDFTEPITVAQLFPIDDFEVDFVDSALTQHAVGGFEGRRDIGCLKFCVGKRPGEKGKIERVKIDEAFKPAVPEDEEESLEQQLYFVALFDVLGFKKLVEQKGSQAILHTYQQLINVAILNKNYTAFGRVEVGSNQYLMGGSYAPIKYAYFSDTIILWTTSCDTHVSPFLAKCCDLICESLRIEMPLRGSVCFGEAIMNKATNTFLGGAMFEASDIEKNQKWIGASLGEAFQLPELRNVVSEALVVPLYCEHLKKEATLSTPYLTLDWVSRWKEKNYPDLISTLEKLKAKAPEKNKVYYDNTIAFINYSALDDFRTRAAFLRAEGFRITNVGKINVRDLHMRLLILKVVNENPHSGFIFTFPDQIVESNKILRELLKNKFLFVNRLDYNRLIEYFSELGKKELRLHEAGFIYQVEKKHVEYLDVFNYDWKHRDRDHQEKNKKPYHRARPNGE